MPNLNDLLKEEPRLRQELLTTSNNLDYFSSNPERCVGNAKFNLVIQQVKKALAVIRIISESEKKNAFDEEDSSVIYQRMAYVGGIISSHILGQKQMAVAEELIELRDFCDTAYEVLLNVEQD